MASFGAQLKREREQRKITLDDISVSTKIGTRFLRAIEENHFDQLPGGIFNKGFVRAYARHLGLDEERTLADFLEATGAEPTDKKSELSAPAPALQIPERDENQSPRIPWGIATILLLIAALVIAIWSFYSREKQKEAGHVNSSSPQSVPDSPASLQPASATQSTLALSADQHATPASVSIQPATGTFVVMLKAHDDSWISINVDGTQLPGQTLVAATEKSFEARRSVMLKAGNIGAVDVYFNGQKIPPQGDEGEVRTLSFDAHGLQAPGKLPASMDSSAR